MKFCFFLSATIFWCYWKSFPSLYCSHKQIARALITGIFVCNRSFNLGTKILLKENAVREARTPVSLYSLWSALIALPQEVVYVVQILDKIIRVVITHGNNDHFLEDQTRTFWMKLEIDLRRIWTWPNVGLQAPSCATGYFTLLDDFSVISYPTFSAEICGGWKSYLRAYFIFKW